MDRIKVCTFIVFITQIYDIIHENGSDLLFKTNNTIFNSNLISLFKINKDDKNKNSKARPLRDHRAITPSSISRRFSSHFHHKSDQSHPRHCSPQFILHYSIPYIIHSPFFPRKTSRREMKRSRHTYRVFWPTTDPNFNQETQLASALIKTIMSYGFFENAFFSGRSRLDLRISDRTGSDAKSGLGAIGLSLSLRFFSEM